MQRKKSLIALLFILTVFVTSCGERNQEYITTESTSTDETPMLLKTYNDAKIGGAWRLSSLMSVPQDKLPSAYIGCGSCTGHCPQSFDIPTYMKEMEDMMKAFS